MPPSTASPDLGPDHAANGAAPRGGQASTPSRCTVCASTRFSPILEKEGHRFVRCAECGLEWIDPPPTDETLAAIYGRHYYDAWGLDQDAETVGSLKRKTFAHVLDQLPAPIRSARGKLLDCGAATGFLLEVARDRGFDPYAVEFSEFGAGELGKKFGRDHVFQGELEKARFPGAGEGAFSAITMCDFLEHVRDPRAILKRARDLLAPGGAIAITTPDASSFSRRVLRDGWTHYKIEHLHYFSPKNITRLLEEVGFGSVQFPALYKRLSVRFVTHQFNVYPHPILSPTLRVLGRVLPQRLQAAAFPIRTGELLAVARRV